MRIGLSTGVTSKPVIRPPFGDEPPDTDPPTITNLEATIYNGGYLQGAIVDADEPVRVRYRWKVGNKGVWSSWSDWGDLGTYHNDNVSSTDPAPPNLWYVQVEAEDEAGNPATNNGLIASKAWLL